MLLTVYQGRNVYNKTSQFFTTDKEWARQFTQSGQDSEIRIGKIDPAVIYQKDPLPEATNEKQMEDALLKEAKAAGYLAIWINEGKNEPPGILVIDMKAVRIYQQSMIRESHEDTQVQKDAEKLKNELTEKYKELEDLFFYVSWNGVLTLSMLRVKKEFRGRGIGSAVMEEIVKFADKNNLIIVLSPEPERRYKEKLDLFYKKFNFVNNKGRNKDYKFSSAFGKTMYRRPRINEAVEGKNYFTKEKFGTLILSELRKIFPSFVTIELLKSINFQEHKDRVFHRSTVHNSSLMSIYSIEYDNKEYEVRIHNTFKKVPDEQLSNKFTMTDDEYLKKMPFKSLEPKDLNRISNLMKWQCRVKRDDDKILIPKKPGYAILFDEYKTLNELISDVKKVIEEDSGFGKHPIIPDIPKVPTYQTINEGVILIHDADKKSIDKYLDDMKKSSDLLFKFYRNKIDSNQLVKYIQEVSDKLKSNKFPFKIEYTFRKGGVGGYYDKSINSIVIVLSAFCDWDWEWVKRDGGRMIRYICHSINWEDMGSTFLHEFVHYIQHVYRSEKSGEYTLPSDWSKEGKYFKRGWEQQAHALGHLEKLKRNFNVKSPKEMLGILKSHGLITSDLLQKLKHTDQKSWKSIMKQAVMTTMADIKEKQK